MLDAHGQYGSDGHRHHRHLWTHEPRRVAAPVEPRASSGQEPPMSESEARIDPYETLFIPKRRRFSHRYVRTPEGKDELQIHFGLKEISFDEPELFPFGENLLKQDSFVAESATTWASGAPYEWDRVKGL